MEANDHSYIPGVLPQMKNPLLVHWIGGSSGRSVGLELAAKKNFATLGTKP
jgi:hypothetical protein